MGYKQDIIPQRPSIWQGSIRKKSKSLISVNLELVYDPWKLAHEALSFLKICEIHIESYISFERLTNTMRPEHYCIMETIALDSSRYVTWSKLRKLLTVNQCAGIVRSDKRPKEVLALTLTSGLKGHAFRDQQKGLCIIYLNGLIPDCSPKMNQLCFSNDYKFNTNWKILAGLLMFSNEFENLAQQTDVGFEVYGSTELAGWLKIAIRSLPSFSTQFVKKRVLLFDRFGDEIFQKNLTSEKFADNTQIFEFGIYSLTDNAITPMTEVYPKSTGGFITTDINNILKNPDILDRMIEAENRLNSTYQFSEWRIVIHSDFLNHIKNIPSKDSTLIEAFTKILLLLNTNQIYMMEEYDDIASPSSDPKKATMKWYSDIVRAYFSQYQGFLYVDDIPDTANTYQKLYPSIDFVNSTSVLLI